MQPTDTTSTSLESPTMIRIDDAPPVMGIIEHLTPSECRLRTMTAFDVGANAAFEFTPYGAPKLAVHGKIVSREAAGSRYVYVLVLPALAKEASAALTAAVQQTRSHAERTRTEVRATPGLTRTSVRVRADFDLSYATGEHSERRARATNISAGGILMNCGDAIVVGSSLRLRFTLPGATEETAVYARVVAHQEASPNYNLAFYDVDAATRAAIERFVTRMGG